MCLHICLRSCLFVCLHFYFPVVYGYLGVFLSSCMYVCPLACRRYAPMVVCSWVCYVSVCIVWMFVCEYLTLCVYLQSSRHVPHTTHCLPSHTPPTIVISTRHLNICAAHQAEHDRHDTSTIHLIFTHRRMRHMLAHTTPQATHNTAQETYPPICLRTRVFNQLRCRSHTESIFGAIECQVLEPLSLT